MTARRIIMNYRKVNIADLQNWLHENNITYDIKPYGDDTTHDAGKRIIGTVNFYVDVYSDIDETAVRLKWKCE